eukprot:TRINITY_DN24471_c0_g1_i1.p1 TRINITY_DN24471_c0_g1~~TRINITY_DN24471_c0_g1_i1.p1  ORF type:complete len:354 (+),score=117.42 TRINITY_DN24471_c0_g1_i1:70-1131(+)
MEGIRKTGEDLEVYRQLQDDEWLAAWLVLEKAKGGWSKWAGWLDVLPKSFENGLHFDKRTLAATEPPHTRADLGKYVNQVTNSFKAFEKAVPGATLAQYKWAKSVLATRAWHLKGKEYLVPGAGMFNHAMDSEDEAFTFKKATGIRSQKFLKYHEVLGDGTAVVYSDRSVGGGEELYESYGDNTNAIYYMYHGFVPERNPYDCYNFRYPALQDADKMNYLRSRLSAHTCLLPNDVPAPFLLYHAVRSLPPARHDCLTTASTLPSLLTCGRHKLKTLKASLKALNHTLSNAFTTTLQNDLDLLAAGEVAGEMKVAIQYRAGQKAILHSVMDELANRIEKRKKKKKKKKANEEEL